MKTPPVPPIKVGDVIRVEEPDYPYGVGPAMLEITGVGVVERLADGWWLNLRGVAVRAGGARRSSCERYVLVRLAALHRQLAVGDGRGD